MTACFTGPRPKNLYGYNERESYEAIINMTQAACEELYSRGVRTFISGGAQGFDQLAFWAVSRLGSKVSNIVYVPFPAQADRWSLDGMFGRQEYDSMLRRADQVHYLFANPTSDEDASDKLFDRNHAMVDASDVVVALLAGRAVNWRQACGGTAECVRYAMRKGKPVLALYLDGSKVWLQ